MADRHVIYVGGVEINSSCLPIVGLANSGAPVTIVVKNVAGDRDLSSNVFHPPTREIDATAVVIEDNVVVKIDAFGRLAIFDRYCEASAVAVVNHIGEDFYISDRAEK